jgi:hypothetical protein
MQDPIKLGFTVIQNLIFQDKNNNPGDLINVFTSVMAEYTKLMNNLLFITAAYFEHTNFDIV